MHDHFDQEPLLTAKVCNKEGTQEQLYQPRNNFNIRNQTKWHMHTSYSTLIYIFFISKSSPAAQWCHALIIYLFKSSETFILKQFPVGPASRR